MENIAKFDIFGVTPKLFINNNVKFNTSFGTMLTVFLLAIIGIASWVYGNDIIYKKNPNSIFTEESTEHPEIFKLGKNTMNVA